MKRSKEREEELRWQLIEHHKQVQDAFDYILLSRKPALNVTTGLRHLITTNMPKDTVFTVNSKGEVVGLIKNIGE